MKLLFLISALSLSFIGCSPSDAAPHEPVMEDPSTAPQGANFFDVEFMGHRVSAKGDNLFQPDRLAHLQWDNLPREWYQGSTRQYLIVKTAAQDTLLVNVDIDFYELLAAEGASLKEGTYSMAQNYISNNSSTECPEPENKKGAFIKLEVYPADLSTSQSFTSASYRFHQDKGSLVIEKISVGPSGKSTVSGYFESTLSQEITSIDTHLDAQAICKADNYRYQTHTIKGSFQLEFKP